MVKFNYLICLIYVNLLAGVYSASILDMLSGKSAREGNDGVKNCICNGPSCICCIDFNISFISLGGPACVRMNYLSPEMGLDMNVSYGDSLIQSNRVNGPDPKPTCLNLLASFAQICATFKELVPENDGLKGCLKLEPTLLGEPQLHVPMGCFTMASGEMKVVDPPQEVSTDKSEESEQNENEQTAEATTESTEIIAGLNAEDILAAVNESANQGIAILTNWLGLGQKAPQNATEVVETSTEAPSTTSEAKTE